MSERAVVIIGFALLLAAAISVALVAHVRRDLVASIGDTITYLTRTRATRIVAVLTWAWLGWHFLAR